MSSPIPVIGLSSVATVAGRLLVLLH
ncbi:unnamed protein product [Staurois parvus]|uniref:Uncharacterized protein n=1 Tax=Staurois parvus TaxID=386267 RepID=A0ABN9BUP8_9NEOB|nr:unnamed protein product [Staurois parvus]